MGKFINKLSNWMLEWGIKGNEVGRVDGIALIDARKRGGSFQNTFENALLLLKHHDPRRYTRVKRYISRIVNVITSDGFTGQYNSSTRTISLEFREMPKFTDEERAAIYAGVLVDKTTLEILRFSGTDHPENKIRKARLFAAEHNRFLEKLVDADLLPFPTFKSLRMEFDEKDLPKISVKKKNFLKMLFSIIWRAATERKIKKK